MTTKGIKLSAYKDTWPDQFEAEKILIHGVLGASARRIEHVGSTSIPNMPAKDIIDIQISVDPLLPIDPYVTALSKIDFTFESLPAPPENSGLKHADEFYPYFRKPNRWPGTHHIHLCQVGSEEEQNHIIFRDYLRQNPQVAEQYLLLKTQLADRYTTAFADFRERYSQGKSIFVRSIIDQAQTAGYRIN